MEGFKLGRSKVGFEFAEAPQMLSLVAVFRDPGLRDSKHL